MNFIISWEWHENILMSPVREVLAAGLEIVADHRDMDVVQLETYLSAPVVSESSIGFSVLDVI